MKKMKKCNWCKQEIKDECGFSINTFWLCAECALNTAEAIIQSMKRIIKQDAKQRKAIKK